MECLKCGGKKVDFQNGDKTTLRGYDSTDKTGLHIVHKYAHMEKYKITCNHCGVILKKGDK